MCAAVFTFILVMVCLHIPFWSNVFFFNSLHDPAFEPGEVLDSHVLKTTNTTYIVHLTIFLWKYHIKELEQLVSAIILNFIEHVQ